MGKKGKRQGVCVWFGARTLDIKEKSLVSTRYLLVTAGVGGCLREDLLVVTFAFTSEDIANEPVELNYCESLRVGLLFIFISYSYCGI